MLPNEIFGLIGRETEVANMEAGRSIHVALLSRSPIIDQIPKSHPSAREHSPTIATYSSGKS